jgi:hypothetical protein
MKLEGQRARQKPRFTRYANALLPTCATVILFFRFAMQLPLRIGFRFESNRRADTRVNIKAVTPG